MDYTNDDALLDPLAVDETETDPETEGVEDPEDKDSGIGVYDITDEGIEEAA